MCGYCGCQDLDAIAELTAERDVVVTLSGQVGRALLAGDLDLAAVGVRTIVAVLRLRTAIRGRALFPDEHRQIERALAESADGTPSDPFWPRRLEQTLVVLRARLSAAQSEQADAARARRSPVRR
ncbi:MAG: hypothetical protein QOD68_1945 [Actinomycetota bacterium]|nr:hypothetical protein [Actinomycetota bacterium]